MLNIVVRHFSNNYKSKLHQKTAAALSGNSNLNLQKNSQNNTNNNANKNDAAAVQNTSSMTLTNNNNIADKLPKVDDDSKKLESLSVKPAALNLTGLHEFAPRITVVGVGGGGGNALNHMIAKQLGGVNFLALNTDAQHLSTTLTDSRIQLGVDLTDGLGCGSNPELGRQAALESKDEILEAIGDSHLVFITAGMGGGTGTGAAPVVAELAYQAGILTLAVVTKPFRFEGRHRMKLANEGVARLKEVSDSLIVVPNQNLFNIIDEDTSMTSALAVADDLLFNGVRTITDLMTKPGLINVDFADVCAITQGMGNAMLGTGIADGEDRAVKAATEALSNPLLGQDFSVKSAKGLLINISGGKDLTLREYDRAASLITEQIEEREGLTSDEGEDHSHASIIIGSAYDETLEGKIRVSVVATGLNNDVIDSY